MTGRRLRKSDLEALEGVYALIQAGTDTAEGVISNVGFGAFGGLFVEFDDGDTAIGWNPEDEDVTITLFVK